MSSTDLAVQKVATTLSSAEFELLTQYFYKEFFDSLHVSASTPNFGKTYNFAITSRNLKITDPLVGQIKTVSDPDTVCYYDRK